jgi:cytochrome c biogenesis factor
MEEPLSSVGRLLVIGGVMLAAVGVIVLLAGKVPFLGRLPGDIVYRKGGTTFYFPLVTCLLLSLLLSLLLNLFRR